MRQARSDPDSNTREGEECVEVDLIIYFTVVRKLLHLMLLPACCLLTHFFFKEMEVRYMKNTGLNKLFQKYY